MSIAKRGKKYSLYRRVPKRYSAIESRTFVWCALGTDSESEAKDMAPLVWTQMLDGWEAKLNGDTSDAEKRFEAAKELAAARGFRYLSADRLAAEPIEEIIKRFKSISGDLDKPNPLEDAALLGAAAPPALKVTKCLELYWELARDKIRGKSDDQLRR